MIPIQDPSITGNSRCSIWRSLGFRFAFVLILLIIAPWTWLSAIPGVEYLLRPYSLFTDWLVNWTNAHILHIRPVLVPKSGSGDTSFGWAEFYTYILISVLVSLLWSFIDHKRRSYERLNYVLCLCTRYYIILVSFIYGYQKVFLLQMPFPGLSAMATPLGDFLPMRLSWMFIGASGPYQFFSGCMELLVGLLLLYRRTATLGTLLAVGVYTNVLMLNLGYDIPVKLFSIQLVFLSLFLLTQEWRRIYSFFVLNRPASSAQLYWFPFQQQWHRVGRVVLKIAFVVLAMIMPLRDVWSYQQFRDTVVPTGSLKKGIYEVSQFIMNGDTLATSVTDSLRWKDMIFEEDGTGSTKCVDTSFRMRYGRGYFYYEVDTVAQSLNLNAIPDSRPLLSFHYTIPDSNTLILNGTRNKDTMHLVLRRNKHHFQLAERQFHWLSETNR